MSVNSNWIWEPEDLEKTPSIVNAGYSQKLEEKMRRKGVHIIKMIGKKLQLKPHPTLATASVFFHRFYMFNTFRDYPEQILALAALYLAGKVEETPKQCKTLVEIASKEFPELFYLDGIERELILVERILLQTIRFDLHLRHPYEFLVPYAKALEQKFPVHADKKYMNAIVGKAWTFTNDSLSTPLCLLWEPEVIAVAMLYLAFKMSQIELEQRGDGQQVDENSGDGNRMEIENKQLEMVSIGTKQSWWEDEITGLTDTELKNICHKVMDAIEATEEEEGGRKM